jgi:hypothetical protein
MYSFQRPWKMLKEAFSNPFETAPRTTSPGRTEQDVGHAGVRADAFPEDDAEHGEVEDVVHERRQERVPRPPDVPQYLAADERHRGGGHPHHALVTSASSRSLS